MVRLDRIAFFQASYMTGHEYLWADVSGQWRFLTPLDPAHFDHAPQNATVPLPPGTAWDVFSSRMMRCAYSSRATTAAPSTTSWA